MKPLIVPSFGLHWTREMQKNHMQRNQLLPEPTEEYYGFTGTKYIQFPTQTNLPLSRYPDVTKKLLAYRDKMIQELSPLAYSKNPLKILKLYRTYLHDGKTGRRMDTKFIPHFPGRDKNGKVQYAQYKGRVVSGNFLGNHLFGQVGAALNFRLNFLKWCARMNARGFDRYLAFQIPKKAHRQFRDTAWDQLAIESGYRDFKTGVPWLETEAFDPSLPHNS